jgi:hypothetical protein
MSASCSQKSSSNPENWSKEELAKWFKNNEWKSGWEIIADESVNQEMKWQNNFFTIPNDGKRHFLL